MPLKLKLAAHECLVVNGAVMVNGGYRATLVIRNFAHIMREKDVLQEEDADTPTRRLYFQVQAMLMQPPPPPELRSDFAASLTELRASFVKPDALAALAQTEQLVAAGDYYKALMALQPLIAYEAALLNVEAPNWRRQSTKTEASPSP